MIGLISNARVGDMVRMEMTSSVRLIIAKVDFDRLFDSGVFQSKTGDKSSQYACYTATLDGSRQLHGFYGSALVEVLTGKRSKQACDELNLIHDLLLGRRVKAKPFTLFEYEGNRRCYMSLSPQMADSLAVADFPDVINNWTVKRGDDPCIRLTKGYRLFSWNTADQSSGSREVLPTALDNTDLKSYCEIMVRLARLGFAPGMSDKKSSPVKEQSFTEALYKDRKAAAVKAAQPVIAKDLEVNTVVSSSMTKGDDKMFQDRYLRACSILTHCREMDEHFVWLLRHGGLDLEHEAALREFHKAVTKFYKRGVKTK